MIASAKNQPTKGGTAPWRMPPRQVNRPCFGKIDP